MTLVVAVVAWGTLATATWAHGRSPRRFAELLEMHFGAEDRARRGAQVAIAIEAMITLGALVGYVASLRAVLVASAVAGFVLGVCYVGWVARLVISDSGLPCACSFSSAPPTWWSVARAGVLCGFGAFIWAPPLAEVGGPESVGVFVAGLALGTVVYAFPEAVAWPASAVALKRQAIQGQS